MLYSGGSPGDPWMLYSGSSPGDPWMLCSGSSPGDPWIYYINDYYVVDLVFNFLIEGIMFC